MSTNARGPLNSAEMTDADFLERQAEECEVWDRWGVADRLRRIAARLRAEADPASRARESIRAQLRLT